MYFYTESFQEIEVQLWISTHKYIKELQCVFTKDLK